jgi:hypothetical protein
LFPAFISFQLLFVSNTFCTEEAIGGLMSTKTYQSQSLMEKPDFCQLCLCEAFSYVKAVMKN